MLTFKNLSFSGIIQEIMKKVYCNPGESGYFALFLVLFYLVGVLSLGSGIFDPVLAKDSGQATKASEQLIFSCEQDIGFSGPVGRFQTYELPTHSNYKYKLVVNIDGIGTFSSTFRNGVSLNRNGAITVCDINDDGFKDIRILGGVDKCGASWYKNWFYDPLTQTFKWHK